MTLKQSFCLPVLPDSVDLNILLPQLADMGFAAVEIWQRDDTLAALAEMATGAGYRKSFRDRFKKKIYCQR